MKCRWFVIVMCFILSAGDLYIALAHNEVPYGQLGALWAMMGLIVWGGAKVIDEIIEYMDRF